MIKFCKIEHNIRELIPEAVRYLSGQKEIIAAYLFGSYAEGKETPLSDFDIAILFERGLTKDEIWKLEELKKHQKLEIENFEVDLTAQLSVERAFQAATESCVDIANHIISTYNLGRPEEQRDVFPILSKAGYSDIPLFEKFKMFVLQLIQVEER